jgi:long-chain acyl-CoA synthetase
MHTLRDLIASLADRGEAPVILATQPDGIETQSYAALAARVRRLAGGLTAAGIGTGDRVALFAAHGTDWIAAAFAALAAGATLVPVDPQSDPRALAHIVADCGASIWFVSDRTEARLRDRAAAGIPIYRLDQAPEDDPAPAPPADPDDIAVLFYTSGTTGLPKGVPLSHRNLLFQVETLRKFDLASASGRVLLALPLHHVYPFSIGLLGVVAHGGALVIPRALTGPEILRTLRDASVTTVIGVPRLFEAFVDGIMAQARGRSRLLAAAMSAVLGVGIALRRWFGVRVAAFLFRRLLGDVGAALRIVVSGGAALNTDLARTMDAIGWTVATGYGLTETAPLLALLPPGDTHFDTVGKPVPGIDIRIAPIPADSDMNANAPMLAARGFGLSRDVRVGEIQARGPGVFSGYQNLSDKTAAAFTPDGWLRTEDLGFLDKRGYLHVLGRHGTLIVTAAGENIQPETIEARLAAKPAIREAGVLQRDGRLAAVIVPDFKWLRSRGTATPENAVRQAIAAAERSVPSHHRLSRHVIGRDALPRTRLGKIRRADLEQRFDEIASGRAAKSGPAPEALSDDDRALLDEPAAHAVWDYLHERYPDAALAPDTSLSVDLGIDSLEWVSLTLAIQQRAAIEISEDATAHIETVRDLLTEAITAESGAPVATLADQPERFISPAQARWLEPLSRCEERAARLLYRLNRCGMRRLFRLRITGKKNLPADGNVIFAPSHASVLDPFVVAAALDYARLRQTWYAGWTGMAFANPLFRLVSRLAQALPIEQDRAAFSSLALGLAVLERGNNLIWFPEGGRSPDGRLQPFLPGIALLLEQRPVPVVPIRICGTFEAMPIGRRMPRLRPLAVAIGRPLSVEQLMARGRGTTPRERIASGLRDAVAALGDDPVA